MSYAQRQVYYYAPPTPAQWTHSLDTFAELLAEDMPLAAIAEQMMVTRGTVTVLLRMLCERMGVEQCR